MGERELLNRSIQELLSSWVLSTGEPRALSETEVDTLKGFLGLFLNQEDARRLRDMYGDSFVSIARAAPREFAIVTLLAHAGVFLLWGLMASLGLLKFFEFCEGLDSERLSEACRNLCDPLTPWLAGANREECEFCGVRACSWHEVAFLLITRTLEAAERGQEEASRLLNKLERDATESGRFGKLGGSSRKTIHRDYPVLLSKFTLEELTEEFVNEVTGKPTISTVFGEHFDEEPREALRRLAMRMQQELPRAWSLKYGSDNRSFAKLEESIIAVIEEHVGKGRACAPRNRLFLQWKDDEGLGPAAIRDKWNAMSDEERGRIAPRCRQRVKRWTVAKALMRERERQTGEKT